MNKIIYGMLSGKFGAAFEIRVLMRQTAKIFGVDAPKTAGLTASELLRRYAKFTADASVRAIKSGQDLKTLRKNLYLMSRRLGSDLRRWMRPHSEQECLAVIMLLYRNIGITIREVRPGKFCVYKCYFSDFYTPEICSVISAIDRGIFAGIFGGGRLVFRKRITEGHRVCIADLRKSTTCLTTDKDKEQMTL